jgi:hypothetical protein
MGPAPLFISDVVSVLFLLHPPFWPTGVSSSCSGGSATLATYSSCLPGVLLSPQHRLSNCASAAAFKCYVSFFLRLILPSCGFCLPQ